MPSAGYILVVEDERDIRDLIAEILEEEGYEAVGAENGAAALDCLREGSSLPSLILLDLMMPVMDGSAFRLEQQRDAVLASIPVILLSANGNLPQRASDLGVAGFVRKPLTPDALLDVVKGHRSRVGA